MYSFSFIKKIACFFFIAAVFAGCHPESNYGEATPLESNNNYLPLNIGNDWTYLNEYTIKNDSLTTLEEKLLVTDSVMEFETPGYHFKSDLLPAIQGPSTALLTHGVVNKVDEKIIFNGAISFYFSDFGDSLKIPVENLLLLNQNTATKHNLSQREGAMTAYWTLGDIHLPIHFSYEVESRASNRFESYDVFNTTFEDVISTQLIVRLKAIATTPDGEEVSILNRAEVYKGEIFFAKDIGMIYNKTNFSFSFTNLESFLSAAPSPMEGRKTQALKKFTIYHNTY